MRKAVLFIISVFVFSACAPKVTVKEFNNFTNELRQAKAKNEASNIDHLEFTKSTRKEVELLKKQIGQIQAVVGITMMQLGQLHQATDNSFGIFIKALENKGIKLDFKKAYKQLQEEQMKNRLKEK